MERGRWVEFLLFMCDSGGYKSTQCTPVSHSVSTREEVFMEGPLGPNMGPSLADVLLCTFESTNAGFPSFPVIKLLS